MSDRRPIFDQINLVVRDMAAMIEFYERLGIPIEPMIEPFAAHHRTFASSAVVDGFDFDLDSDVFAPQWNVGWPPGQTGPVLGFRLGSAEAVDATYEDLTGAGYIAQQPPHDGLMGARYAVVCDPDGNSVGLMGPIDLHRKTVPQGPRA
jgi:catechol 2,3-dioxygenase-like lactoylglutathione lyase family enzyme